MMPLKIFAETILTHIQEAIRKERKVVGLPISNHNTRAYMRCHSGMQGVQFKLEYTIGGTIEHSSSTDVLYFQPEQCTAARVLHVAESIMNGLGRDIRLQVEASYLRTLLTTQKVAFGVKTAMSPKMPTPSYSIYNARYLLHSSVARGTCVLTLAILPKFSEWENDANNDLSYTVVGSLTEYNSDGVALRVSSLEPIKTNASALFDLDAVLSAWGREVRMITEARIEVCQNI